MWLSDVETDAACKRREADEERWRGLEEIGPLVAARFFIASIVAKAARPSVVLASGRKVTVLKNHKTVALVSHTCAHLSKHLSLPSRLVGRSRVHSRRCGLRLAWLRRQEFKSLLTIR